MKISKYHFLLISFLVCFILINSSQLFAKNSIYKCIDSKGRTTYSANANCDKPTEIKVSKKVVKRKAISNQQQEKNQIVENNRIEQCQSFKATLGSYKRAPFLTKTKTIDGQLVKSRLSAEEKDKAILEAQADVDYWCDD